MNFVEMMLMEKLKDADPALDLLGSDRKVLQVVCQDFTNYLKYHWDLIGKDANQCEIAERLELQLKENPRELEEFLSVWVNIWFKKWKERVKLLIGNQNVNKWNRTAKILSDAEPFWKTLENRTKIQEFVVATLLKNGEICGTDILSENLIKMELGDKYIQTLEEKERIMTVVNNALRKARDMAQSKGPLIFVKIDKAYYESTNY
jgi:hypothetical protein